MLTPRPRVYFAGPDVFRPDAAAHFQGLVQACAALALEGVRPFDGTAEAAPADEDLPRVIYDENMRLLRSADGVIANLTPFRGAEPDSGTVFEVGVAVALGLPVVAYGVPPSSYATRVPAHRDTAWFRGLHGQPLTGRSRMRIPTLPRPAQWPPWTSTA